MKTRDHQTNKARPPLSGAGKRRTADNHRWQAVASRDRHADGCFVYSVETTGVYCRPSCPAKRPRREHVRFYSTPAEAERAGFRPCKRCRPDANASAWDLPHADAVIRACELIEAAEEPPALDALAGAVQLSPSHFHRLFKSMIGLTPKAYAIGHRSERVRRELRRGASVTSAIYRAGFNSNGRFYDASSKILGMKPKQFRAGGEGERIEFAVAKSWLGPILVAASQLGVCSIKLGDDPDVLVRELEDEFPRAELSAGGKPFQEWIARVVAFVGNPALGLNLPLHIRGTAFQQRVWQALREIPLGATRTYAELAKAVGNPKAVRAVASACAANPVALVVPCHRVIRTDGSLSGYRWGVERKAKLLDAERAASAGRKAAHSKLGSSGTSR